MPRATAARWVLGAAQRLARLQRGEFHPAVDDALDAFGLARAWQARQRRDDVYGKTGTTNDSFDAWFAGYQPTRVGGAWIGYATPRQRGGQRGETGGSVALPVASPMSRTPPAGVVQVEGERYYEKFGPGGQGLRRWGWMQSFARRLTCMRNCRRARSRRSATGFRICFDEIRPPRRR